MLPTTVKRMRAGGDAVSAELLESVTTSLLCLESTSAMWAPRRCWHELLLAWKGLACCGIATDCASNVKAEALRCRC